ncbi:hypothetical protein EF919_38630 [Streptomyces sp. WAC02707]|uniref:colicin immunity domain-containing protein n=1 Tax=Streptomyces sp. WAC02707 TaxID=2487417 RepID=UPI000F77F34A|nr:colicin immunity domain-containing protein [Streptomyces sp. WAC02707]RSS84604.1 hypothetical protein EF919_38630 [Streptomyces sp. WAC02707]
MDADALVAPIPAGPRPNPSLWLRLTAGCRAVGATELLYEPEGTPPSRLPLTPPPPEDIHPPCVLRTPDGQGVVRFPAPGYALIGGTARFMAAAVAEGTDEARARFARHARRHPDPALTTVATAHPPGHRAWSAPSAVAPDSAAARQLRLLADFTSGRITAPAFALAWHPARRASRANGERLRSPLSDLFDGVFVLLEDYTPDPSLREPGDLSDTELLTAVKALTRE